MTVGFKRFRNYKLYEEIYFVCVGNDACFLRGGATSYLQ